MSKMSNTDYKRVPLHMWEREKLLDRLTDNELLDLYSYVYTQVLDHIEPSVDASDYKEANSVIMMIKGKL